MAVGGLIAGLCGLCTGGFEIAFIYDAWSSTTRASRGGGDIDFPFYMPLLVGIVPILIGVGLFVWGRRILRASAGQ